MIMRRKFGSKFVWLQIRGQRTSYLVILCRISTQIQKRFHAFLHGGFLDFGKLIRSRASLAHHTYRYWSSSSKFHLQLLEDFPVDLCGTIIHSGSFALLLTRKS